MKTLNLYLTFILMFGLSLNAFSQSWQFAKSFGGVDHSPYNDCLNLPQCMEVDNEGNTYMFGTYGALTQINDSTLPYYNDGCSGSFIVKYNCAGEVLWHKAIANTQNSQERAHYMVLKNQHLYITGTMKVEGYSKTWWIDTLVQGFNIPYPYEYPWIPHRCYNYVIKMDLDGNIIENHRLNLNRDYDTPPPVQQRAWWHYIYMNYKQNALGIDNDGNYYMFAQYNNEKSFNILEVDNQPVSDTVFSENNQTKVYLLKFDSNFNFIFHKLLVQGMSNDSTKGYLFDFSDVRCDSENNLYVVGTVRTNCSVDTAITHIDLGNNQFLTTYGDRYKTETGFLLKMNSEGEVLWTQQTKQFFTGFGSFASFNSLILDEPTQSIYISGEGTTVTNEYPGNGTILGDSDTLINTDFQPAGNIGYIAKYDMQGNYHWFKSPYSPNSKLSSIDLYNGQIYTSIMWRSSLQHGEDSYNIDIYNDQGLAICAWDTMGNPTLSINVPSTCTYLFGLVPFDLRLNNRGEISVSGTYKYSLNFGEDTIYAQGSNKMFVAKYGKACPVLLEENGYFCYGDTYRDSTLWQSGNYQFIVETPAADSVINLNATVHPQITSGLNDTVAYIGENLYLECTNTNYDAYQWSTGSNTYFENLMFNNTGTETVYITITDSICSATDTIHININTSGIEETEKSTAIYPNPAGSILNINGKGINLQSYTISDLNGKILLKGSNRTVNINNLPPGSYLIQLIDTGNKVYYQKFVKE